MLSATVDPDWHSRWNLRRASLTRCHRGWRRATVRTHWWRAFRETLRPTAAPQSLSTAAEPLPSSESWTGAGHLSYNRFVRHSFSVRLADGPLGTSTVWRAVPSCDAGRRVWSQTAHCALSRFCRPDAQARYHSHLPCFSSRRCSLVFRSCRFDLIRPRGADGCSPVSRARTFPGI